MNYVPSLDVHRQLLDHAITLRQLERPAGEVYLDKYLPELTTEDREWALSHYCGTRTRPMPAKPDDALFCAAMFMAGVSYGDLSMLFKIRKQTVAQKVSRRVSDTERKTMRDELKVMDLEVLALCKEIFDNARAVSGHSYEGVHPLEIGRGLLKAATALIARDRGDADFAEARNRPRRYANMDISPAQPALDGPPVTPPAEPTSEPPCGSSPTPNILRPEEQEFLKGL